MCSSSKCENLTNTHFFQLPYHSFNLICFYTYGSVSKNSCNHLVCCFRPAWYCKVTDCMIFVPSVLSSVHVHILTTLKPLMMFTTLTIEQLNMLQQFTTREL